MKELISRRLSLIGILVLLICVSGELAAQQTTFQERFSRIQKLQDTIDESFKFDYSSLRNRAEEKNVRLNINLINSGRAQLQYFDSDGFPVYFRPFNVDAALTTGASSLQLGGGLNLNLTGRDLLVGVWDQDASKADHIEFGSRVTRKDGASEFSSGHGTHVMGTILAEGVSANAKGMATEASGSFYDWTNDLAEMLASAYDPEIRPSGNLISNHSYGISTGWENEGGGDWTWFGNESISEEEDYRFGFYNSKSKSLDEIAFEYPYYSIFWAAGNDRSDVGDGTHPPDGPDDTISPEGAAKNVFTIGAVGEVQEYSGPSSISMTSFSSWGPTDDGRIKPDLVGMGVGVFSSYFSKSEEIVSDSYTNLNGTSMAAPNVAGSLLLLQDLYRKRYNGDFMKSSTLKALAIHTAKEAGSAQGPDYIYGWGLVDVERAAQLILDEDGANILILEEELKNDQIFEIDFVSKDSDFIKISIAWTDPAGTPVSAALDPENLMLVNDLDLRLIDEEGQVYFPWSLDPSKGVGATARQSEDNFRDNVEQIFFANPQNGNFKLQVSHKGTLVNDSQSFSIIFEAKTENGSDETLYWVGSEGGNWDDVSNWSTSSGGIAANRIPSARTKVVFDENSFNDSETEILLNSNAEVNSLYYYGDNVNTLELQGNSIKILNSIQIGSDQLVVENGEVLLSSQASDVKTVDLGSSDLSTTSINVETGNWRLMNSKFIDGLTITTGAGLEVMDQDFQLNKLTINSGSVVQFVNTNILGLSELSSNLQSFEMGDSNFIEFNDANSTLSALGFSVGNIKISSGVTLVSTGMVKSNILEIDNGNLEINNDWDIDLLNSVRDIEIVFGSGSDLNVSSDWIKEEITSLNFSNSGSDNGGFNLGFREIVCLPNTNVLNVDLGGASVVSVGLDSEINNSLGWLEIPCDQLVLAEFDFKYACLDSYAEFRSISEGQIDEFGWSIDGQTFDGEEFVYLMNSPGSYELELTVSNGFHSNTLTSQIEVLENDIRKPEIVVNGNVLASTASGSEYKWYLNGQIIEGQSGRTLEVSDDGIYQVAVFGSDCNRVSESIVISSIEEAEPALQKFGITIGPNPIESGLLTIGITNDYRGSFEVQVIDALGRLVSSQQIDKSQETTTYAIEFNYKPGLYFVRIGLDQMLITKKIIKL